MPLNRANAQTVPQTNTLPVIPSTSAQGKSRAVLMLILAAIGVSICVGVAGWLHYDAARRLNDSRDWLEHSETIVSNLQMQTQRLDRIEPAIRLYQLTSDDNNLRSAQANTVAFHS